MQCSAGRLSRPRALLGQARRVQSRGGMAIRAAFQGAGPLEKAPKVVGMGSCGVDYLASVGSFPRPDDKLRTEKLEVQGGGNTANALTAASRLGLHATLVTKIGADGLGDSILSELHDDGIDTQHVMREPGHSSPFTYIIVDRSGGTRTCIHTPGAPLTPQEMTQTVIQEALRDASLVYFDGRLADAAVLLARAARAAGVAVLVEAERLRPGLDDLLQLADYVVTSAHFPQDWTGESVLEDALLCTALRLPNVRFIATTLGTRGSVLMERDNSAQDQSDLQEARLVDIMSQLGAQLGQAEQADEGQGPDCVTATGLAIRRGGVVSTPGPVRLTFSSEHNATSAAAGALAAAQRAAALNADAANAAGYQMAGSGGALAVAERPATVVAAVTRAAIAKLDKADVVDTTGAGDAFIGSVLYGLVTGMPRDRMMQLAGLVAAAKCTRLGARPGLPTRSQLSSSVL